MHKSFTLVILGICTFFLAFPLQGQDNSALVESSISAELDQIEVYPNPAIDHIYVSVEEEVFDQIKLEMFNIIGNQVQLNVEKVNDSEYRIPVSTYNTGYYLLLISDRAGRVNKAFKFMKR